MIPSRGFLCSQLRTVSVPDVVERGIIDQADKSTEEINDSALPRLLHDSLVPEPAAHGRKDGKQMWLAIALALLLGGLLFAGLYFIASGDHGPRASSPHREKPSPYSNRN